MLVLESTALAFSQKPVQAGAVPDRRAPRSQEDPMSDLHVVTGAGPVGWTVAEQLARAGQEVRVLTRSGSGPEHPLIERRAVDVSDAVAFAAAARGARAVFHCVHGTSYSEKT